MKDFKHLLILPGEEREKKWLAERLETLSVKEGCILRAALARQPPKTMMGAVNCLQSLQEYAVCYPARDYCALGQYYAEQKGTVPREALPHIDFAKLGQIYGDKHPGCFVEGCYVEYPEWEPDLSYQGKGFFLPEDDTWSVKLKLASPSCPEGVWIRLPDFPIQPEIPSAEVQLSMAALGVSDIEECTLLEAHCILPEIKNLLNQYDNITELISHGENLGIVLEERGQGMPQFIERFAAAIEYEDCRTLRFALDISQNLSCYEWVLNEEVKNVAINFLRSCKVEEELIQSGAIDLKSCAEDLLETSGYMQASGEAGYVTRNNQRFVYEYSASEQGGW